MAEGTPNLRLLGGSAAGKELDLASEVFHRINRIIPENQVMLTLPPACRVQDAIARMLTHGYSQVPVVDNGEVLGVFSFRSFARETANTELKEWNQRSCAPGDLRVDDCLETFEFARFTEEMKRVFAAVDRDNGILIGTPELLIAMLTPMDLLNYFYKVAGPFVLVSEIELALRALIRSAMSKEEIASAAIRCLMSFYGTKEKVPTSLQDMSFDNYQSLISHGENWPLLQAVFGGTRGLTRAKLKEVGQIRNDLFHFRREITLQDHETLARHRDWFLSKIKQAEGHRKAGVRS